MELTGKGSAYYPEHNSEQGFLTNRTVGMRNRIMMRHGDGGPMPDLFISHASADTEAIARPIAEKLQALGYEVWFDEITLKVGDSLRRRIDDGLRNARFGLVILSEAFFNRH